MGNTSSSSSSVNNNQNNNNTNNYDGCPVASNSESQHNQQYTKYNNNNNNNNNNNKNNNNNLNNTDNNNNNNNESENDYEGCPVAHNYKNPKTYNVYGEEINPDNQMPAHAKQKPFPGQRLPLPTERAQSNIRKGGTDGTWTYPSEQMFYNAIMRKGKGENVDEKDIETVLAIHNGVNERSWQMIMDWERLHAAECQDPTLLRFYGKPNDTSPKATFKNTLLGYPKPFDRHDWYIDRCGLKEVRYVIDYYYDNSVAEEELETGVDGFSVPKRVIIDARPALDNIGNAYDRFRCLFQSNNDHQSEN